MATYKVIQDIEAEDKLLGPLSLRQFLYAAIVVILGYLSFRLFPVQPLLIVPLLPPAVLFAFLAAPLGHEQSSEIWLLAKIRFFLKPRIRIWDQTGLQELVTVTAPKQVEQAYTKDLDETQVRSRLEALAQTIDTRGWVVKGVDLNLYTNPAYTVGGNTQAASDRLVDPSVMSPQQVSDVQLTLADDILDATNNPIAQQMDQLVKASDQAHREQVLNQMQQIRESKDTSQPGTSDRQYADPQQSYATFTARTVQPMSDPYAIAPQVFADPVQATIPDPTPADEQQMAAHIQENLAQQQARQRYAYGRTHVLPTTQPAEPPPPNFTPSTSNDNDYSAASRTAAPPDNYHASTLPSAPPMTAATKPDILDLASNDDLSVATLARQANERAQPSSDDEVVITLR